MVRDLVRITYLNNITQYYIDIEELSIAKSYADLFIETVISASYLSPEFKEKFKKAGKSIINYAKKNPDEFGVLGASYGIPLILGAKYAKSGNIKKAALVSSIAAFPIGEGYIVAKKGIQLARKKRKELLNGEKK